MDSNLTAAIVLGLLLVGYPLLWLLPPLNRYATRQWVLRQHLPVRPDDLRWIARRRTTRTVSLALGALVGLLATIPVRWAAPALAQPALQVWSWAVLAITGGAVGLTVHGLRASRPRPDLDVRVAHSSAARLSDYISARVLRTTRTLAGLVVVAALVSVMLPVWRGPGFGPDESGPVWVGLGVLLGGWVFAELLGRRICAQPQPAGDPLGLAWDDALRSEQVRDAFSIPTSLSIVAAGLAALPAEGSVAAAPWTELASMALLGVLVATLVTGVVLAAASLVPVAGRRRDSVLAAAREG